jgi:hypothetical protein
VNAAIKVHSFAGKDSILEVSVERSAAFDELGEKVVACKPNGSARLGVKI